MAFACAIELFSLSFLVQLNSISYVPSVTLADPLKVRITACQTSRT